MGERDSGISGRGTPGAVFTIPGRISLACAVALVCSGCPMSSTIVREGVDAGQDAGTTAVGGSGGAGGSSTAQEGCEPRGVWLPCYCTDGSLSGSQFCDEQGRLTECTGCDPAEGGSGGLVPDQRPALCPELQGVTGCMSPIGGGELPASILFLVDRSATMRCNTPADGQTGEECRAAPGAKFPDLPSKWEITVEALTAIVERLAMAGDGNRVGLMFFGADGLDDCQMFPDPVLNGVPLERLNDEQVVLLDRALRLTEPGGEKPLIDASLLAYDYLHNLWGDDCGSPPCGAPGNRFMVLVTDGVDTCPEPDMTGLPCDEGDMERRHDPHRYPPGLRAVLSGTGMFGVGRTVPV